MIKLSSTEKLFENILVTVSEDSLGESKNKYPTIPAIEVAIPHVYASLNSTFLKSMAVTIKSLRCLIYLLIVIQEKIFLF